MASKVSSILQSDKEEDPFEALLEDDFDIEKLIPVEEQDESKRKRKKKR